MAKESGRIELDGDRIRYTSVVYPSWILDVERIRIIGEATNPDGPFSDDYFLCFAIGNEAWLEASVYSSGCSLFLGKLEDRLGANLQLQLSWSTDFASRILWPPELTDQPMFDYETLKPKFLFGFTKIKTIYSEASINALR